jgi:hypothetical protein
MTTEVARCAIYDRRPGICKRYPEMDHYIPPECTYYFQGSERKGDCSCDIGACCAIPRMAGMPGGAPMPAIAGGRPCEHLVWVEKEESKEKSASSLPAAGRSKACKDFQNELSREE